MPCSSPTRRIVSDQASKIVFIVDSEDIVRARKVQLGILSDGLRVIRDGLQGEDRVVLDGLANPVVRPGAR